MSASALFEDLRPSGTVARDTDKRVIYLAERLGIALCGAIGIVESIRLFAYDYLPKKNIGKYSDEDIAMSIFWNGNPSALVQALIDVGWIKPDPTFRLKLVGWSWKKGNAKTRRRERMRTAGGVIPQHIRHRIFERDGRRCLSCKSMEDLTIDHIIPISHDGTNEDSNLQTLCRTCNGRKRDRLETAI